MSYNITKTDGSKLIELVEEVINSEAVSNIGLIGKLSPNYGETQSNNFVHLAENFAAETFPKTPLKGMLCYRTDRKGLYICVNDNVDETNIEESWVKLPSVKFETLEPPASSAQKGDMWFNEETKKLYVFDSILKKWVCIGPDDYLNSISTTDVGETGDGSVYTYTYNFDKNKELNDTSYLATIKIIGKEIIPSDSSLYGIKETETAAWIVKMLINSYTKTINDEDAVMREIVGEPNYETIGRTLGVAQDWTVETKLEDVNHNLQVIVKGSPTNSKDELKIQWVINVEMTKVYDKGEI